LQTHLWSMIDPGLKKRQRCPDHERDDCLATVGTWLAKDQAIPHSPRRKKVTFSDFSVGFCINEEVIFRARVGNR